MQKRIISLSSCVLVLLVLVSAVAVPAFAADMYDVSDYETSHSYAGDIRSSVYSFPVSDDYSHGDENYKGTCLGPFSGDDDNSVRYRVYPVGRGTRLDVHDLSVDDSCSFSASVSFTSSVWLNDPSAYLRVNLRFMCYDSKGTYFDYVQVGSIDISQVLTITGFKIEGSFKVPAGSYYIYPYLEFTVDFSRIKTFTLDMQSFMLTSSISVTASNSEALDRIEGGISGVHDSIIDSNDKLDGIQDGIDDSNQKLDGIQDGIQDSNDKLDEIINGTIDSEKPAGSDIVDDYLDAENRLHGGISGGFDEAEKLQRSALDVFTEYVVAFGAVAWIFDLFANLTFFNMLLKISLWVGFFAALLNIPLMLARRKGD